MEQHQLIKWGGSFINESIVEMRNWIEPLVRFPNRELGDAPIDQEMLPSELPITIYSKPIKDKYKVITASRT